MNDKKIEELKLQIEEAQAKQSNATDEVNRLQMELHAIKLQDAPEIDSVYEDNGRYWIVKTIDRYDDDFGVDLYQFPHFELNPNKADASISMKTVYCDWFVNKTNVPAEYAAEMAIDALDAAMLVLKESRAKWAKKT